MTEASFHIQIDATEADYQTGAVLFQPDTDAIAMNIQIDATEADYQTGAVLFQPETVEVICQIGMLVRNMPTGVTEVAHQTGVTEVQTGTLWRLPEAQRTAPFIAMVGLHSLAATRA